MKFVQPRNTKTGQFTTEDQQAMTEEQKDKLDRRTEFLGKVKVVENLARELVQARSLVSRLAGEQTAYLTASTELSALAYGAENTAKLVDNLEAGNPTAMAAAQAHVIAYRNAARIMTDRAYKAMQELSEARKREAALQNTIDRGTENARKHQ